MGDLIRVMACLLILIIPAAILIGGHYLYIHWEEIMNYIPIGFLLPIPLIIILINVNFYKYFLINNSELIRRDNK